MKKFLLPFLFTAGITPWAFSQMTATFTQTVNTQCAGADCNYTGPTILINELMISPNSNDGCLSGTSSGGTCRGEWIELYNPDLCQPIDISCYYLGNSTAEGNGGFLIPAGTIIPAGGFCLIRGENAEQIPANSNLLVGNGGKTVQITVPGVLNPSNGVCASGSRLWFPNAGGWFAFYDRNGVPQDAVGWGSGSGVSNSSGIPCVPTLSGCNNSVTTLASYNNIPSNRKTHIGPGTSGGIFQPAPAMGKSFQRATDGGAWNSQGNPTLGTCNAICATVSASTCDGTATINVTGGTAPYNYKWDDSQGQLTQTATGLCGKTYNVLVTDNVGATQTFQVTVVDNVPAVTFDPLTDICNKGQNIPLVGSPTPTAGQSGVFSGTGVSGSNFSATTSGDGSFTLTYSFKDENGCANSATSSINVYPQPVASISGVDANYCLSDLIITPNVLPAGGVLSGPGVSNGQFSIAAAGAGTHTLKYVVVTSHGCADSTQVTVTISSNPTASFTLQPDICAMAAPIQLSGSPIGGVFTVNGQQITEFDPTSYTLGQYTITYSVADPTNPQCNSTATNTINVVDGLPISSNIPDYFCFGSSDFNIVITPAGGQLTANPSDILVGDQLIISSATDGTYSVSYEYTTPEGCHSTYDKTFTVGKELKLKYDFAQDCFQNVTLTAKPTVGNFVQYTWILDNTIQIGSGNPFTGYIEQYGEHEFTVEAKDNHGCTTTYSQKDSVAEGVKAGMFQIPNVVTANGDGINDVIFMPLMDNNCINYEVLILNRWGNLVYKANKANPSFGGKDMNGKVLTDGVYFYKVVSESFDCESDEYKPICYGFITVISK